MSPKRRRVKPTKRRTREFIPKVATMKSPQTRDTTKFKAVEEQEVDILIKMVESR